MKREYCVYVHTFPNGKIYIGQTNQKPEYRWQKGDGYKGQPYLYAAIQKYGWNNISHEIIISGLDSDSADEWENSLIALYRSNEQKYGYNLRSGGTSGYQYTEEARKKMSEIQMGRKQSEITRKKHSEALKRYYSEHKVSEETREKLRKANKGKKRPTHDCSPETRKKISDALKGKKGKPLTEQEKKHLSEMMKARGTTIQMMENIVPHQFQKGHPPNEKAMSTLREKYSKRIAQYDLNGNFVAFHSSVGSASKSIGMTRNAVGNCVRGRAKTAGGYVWRYADGE